MKVKEESEKAGLKLNFQKTISNRWGNNRKSEILYFGGSKITADHDYGHEIKRCLLLWRKIKTNLDSIIKSRDIALPTSVCLVKAMFFPVVLYGCETIKTTNVVLYGLDYKESWALQNWRSWTVVLEKTLESPLGCKDIQPVHPKGNQSWIFIGRTDDEAETPPDVKNWLIVKDPDAGKDWRWEKKGTMRLRWLDGITDWRDMSLSKFWEFLMGREVGRAAAHGVAKSRTQLSD